MRRMINNEPTVSAGSLRSAYTVRCLEKVERYGVVDRIERLPSIDLSPTAWSEIARLTARREEVDRGFAARKDYEETVNALRSGNVFTVAPQLILISEDEGENLKVPCEVILRDRNGKNIALMHVTEKFSIDIGSLELITARNEELVSLIREYLLFGYDLAIAAILRL